MRVLAYGGAFLVAATTAVLLHSHPADAAETVPLFDRLAAVQQAYPFAVAAIELNALVMADGSRIEVDDGRRKDHQAKLAAADIEDMLSQIYPIGACDDDQPPTRDFDPGRIRNDAVFRALYGGTQQAVAGRLVSVDWFGSKLPFTPAGGADAALRAVARDLAADPSLRKYLVPSAGTFNWRVVAGTKRLSAHSFGAAIDLNTKFADYWLWSGGKAGAVPAHRNRFPKAIVDVFERHGFIWGGKWYHYDTMHFEYRPELIAIGRMAEARGCPRS